MKRTLQSLLILVSLLMAGTGIHGFFNNNMFSGEAQARVGRPLTPVSVAGVARRTTRRTIRRTAVYAATLPGGCKTVIVEGVSLHKCGGAYYQPYQNQFVVVTVH